MSTNSKIQWTDATWNPITGCSKVSPGCENCYALRMSHRLSFNPFSSDKYLGTTLKTPGGKIQWSNHVEFHPDDLTIPLYWQKPRRIFVGSMSDIFHENVSWSWIEKIFAVMALCPQHNFQILTKRPERAAEFYRRCQDGYVDGPDQEAEYFSGDIVGKYGENLNKPLIDAGWQWAYYEDDCSLEYHGPLPFPHIWIGTSVENQEQAEKRIPHLLQIPAAVHYVSCEPLLGPVNLNMVNQFKQFWIPDPKDGIEGCPQIDWIIAGGESGPGARPVHPEWVRDLRDQAKAGGIPFFFKQWGEYLPFEPDAQPPFYSPSNKPDHFMFDGHGMNFIDPEKDEPGKFQGHRWMDTMEAATICLETDSDDCMFLKTGKHKSGNHLDNVQHLEFPKS